MTKKADHHYSGDQSKAFWRRVRRLPEPEQSAAYALGVALQNLEEFVLRQIANSEQEKK